MQAKLTEYNGTFFRSNLEVQWTQFFCQFGVRFEYEPEAIKTKLGWYVPDFKFRSLRCFVEIKGKSPTTEEVEKLKSCCDQTGYIGFIISKYPDCYFYGVDPHISNSAVIIIKNGKIYPCSADEIFQTYRKQSLMFAIHKCKATDRLYSLRSIPDMFRCQRLLPAKAKFKPESKDLEGFAKHLFHMFKRLNRKI